MPFRVDWPSRRGASRLSTKLRTLRSSSFGVAAGRMTSERSTGGNLWTLVPVAPAVIRVAIERQVLAAIGARRADRSLQLSEAALYDSPPTAPAGTAISMRVPVS